MTTYEETELGIRSVQELEMFLHEFLPRLPADDLKDGEDLLPHIERLGLQTPEFLGGELTWQECTGFKADEAAGDTLVLIRPGHADAIGLVIRCVRWGHWTACLECGWIWCRIVLTRRF